MSLTEPKIICIMPCYNAEKTLAKAIESITKQNYTNWELIIVDDASTDKSVNVAKKYLKDSRITLLQNKTNRGCYYSRNRALYHVKDQEWDWFTIHDSDDVSHPDRFAIYMAHAYQGDYDYIYSTARGTRNNWYDSKVEYQINNNFPGQAFISNLLFTSKLGYFDPETRFSGDSEYAFRYKQLIATIISHIDNVTDMDSILDMCYKRKQFISKLDKKYSYTYTFGFNLGTNLTYLVSKKERLNYTESFETKWGKGGVPLKDFYISFTPEQEDL